MTCPWKEIEQLSNGRKRVRCEKCFATLSVPQSTVPEKIQGCKASDRPRPAATVQALGPGTELARILAGLKAEKTEGCGCEQMIARMNAWGPDGCIEHLSEIVAHLRKAYKTTPWASVTSASMAAFASGLAFQLDWTDPIPSLVKLAIARARKP